MTGYCYNCKNGTCQCGRTKPPPAPPLELAPNQPQREPLPATVEDLL